MASEKRIVFHDEDLQQDSFVAFENMRRNGEFCDITINFGNESISIHKLVVAAGIPYFEEILGNPKTESTEKIALEDIDSYALKSLLSYAYTCRIEITDENVLSILHGACALHVNRVRDACCRFLADCLRPDNVLGIRQLAYDLNCSNLLKIADNYICENFEDVSCRNEFLKLPFHFVKSLIGRDDLNVSSEDEVLRVVLTWFKTSPTERENYLRNLLNDVRVMYITPKYLNYVMATEEIVRQVFSYITTTRKGIHSLSESGKLTLYPKHRPRYCQKKNEYMKAFYIFFIPIFVCFLVRTELFLWFIGSFVVMVLDIHFRLVTVLSNAASHKTLVQGVIVSYMMILFFRSPLKCLLFIFSKILANQFLLQ